ncbi:hypothetical protein GYH30_008093 [Glycine max]|nr:hypothetical protein GYH30_008093 [Glycine max]
MDSKKYCLQKPEFSLPTTHDGARAAPPPASSWRSSATLRGTIASAIDAFANVAVHYLLNLGRTVESHANHAGRMQCTVFDAIRGMEDLEATRAFADASSIREIINFVESIVDEIPFAQPISNFLVVQE